MLIDYLSLSAFTQGTAAYTHVHEIHTNLQALGVDVELFVPHYPRPTRSVIIRAWKMLGLQIRLAWKWVIRSKPDIFYIRHHYVGFPITLFAHLWKIPVVVEVNGPVEDFIITWSIPRYLAPIVKKVAYWQAQLSDWAIAVTPGLAESLSSEYRIPSDRISLIPNGVNADLFHPIPDPDLNSWSDLQVEKYVIFVGALTSWQSINVMIEAVCSESWQDHVRLVICGDGRLRKIVESAQTERLVYLGNVPYERMPQLINASIGGLCLINDPSRDLIGVSPLKLYEYTACAKPVITTNLPGLTDFVTQLDIGIIIPINDPRALCAAVKQLIDDAPKWRLKGKSAAAFVRKHYSWRSRAQQTLALLENIVDKKQEE
jgi:glycosyltransferase involved in cell wall biosynthesis